MFRIKQIIQINVELHCNKFSSYIDVLSERKILLKHASCQENHVCFLISMCLENLNFKSEDYRSLDTVQHSWEMDAASDLRTVYAR